MHRVLITGQYGEVFRGRLEAVLGAAGLVDTWRPEDGAEAMILRAGDATVIVASAEWLLGEQRTLVPKTLAHARQLQLLLVPFSGMDWLDASWLPSGCRVCNTNAGIDPIAEYVMLAMLETSIHLGEMDRELRAGRWTWGGSSVLGRKHRELQGRTIGLVGYGRIAHRVAELAKAFRMRAVAVSRNPRPDDGVSWWKGMDALDELLAESDYVLLAVPGGAKTEGLIGAAQIARMKPDAVLINVARGPVVDENALFDALGQKRIGGAVIDTWYRYPGPENRDGLPANLPFEQLDNVLMSPHAAGWTEELDKRRVAAVAENLARFVAGETLNDIYLQAEFV